MVTYADRISRLRAAFEVDEGHVAAIQIGEAAQYLRLLSVIKGRYDVANEDYFRIHDALQAFHSPSGGIRQLSAAEELLLGELREAGEILRLELDSFFIFARIVLDKTAVLFEFFFGEVRRIGVTRHSRLAKYVESYLSALNLPQFSQSGIDRIRALESDVGDVRNHLIVHKIKRRAIRHQAWGPEREVIIAHGLVYPKETDTHEGLTSKSPSLLLPEIDGHLDCVLGYIEDNLSRSRLRLAAC